MVCDFSVFDRSIVSGLPQHWGLTLFILNVILPGIGTIASAFIDKEGFNCLALIIGIMQSLLTLLVIGWLWSIFHGWAMFTSSSK